MPYGTTSNNNVTQRSEMTIFHTRLTHNDKKINTSSLGNYQNLAP
jgi:hypothetical protein